MLKKRRNNTHIKLLYTLKDDIIHITVGRYIT